MQRDPTPHLIQQARQVAELLDQGYTNKRIGEEMGVTSVRISQIRSRLPELAPYLGTAAPMHRLRGHRDQLWSLRRQTLQLAATIRMDLRDLDEELEAARLDGLLGLRAG